MGNEVISKRVVDGHGQVVWIPSSTPETEFIVVQVDIHNKTITTITKVKMKDDSPTPQKLSSRPDYRATDRKPLFERPFLEGQRGWYDCLLRRGATLHNSRLRK